MLFHIVAKKSPSGSPPNSPHSSAPYNKEGSHSGKVARKLNFNLPDTDDEFNEDSFHIVEDKSEKFVQSESEELLKSLPRQNYLLGKQLLDSFDEEKLAQARELFKQAADAGNQDACFEFGKMCRDGVGGLIDKQSAFEYIKKAADPENPEACFVFGQMCKDGVGCSIDNDIAFTYFGLATEGGLKAAYFERGIMFQHGLGCKKNDAEAFKCFEQAVVQGHGRVKAAFLLLGKMYKDGLGTFQNSAKAVRYLTLANDNNSLDATILLGEMYRDGCGVEVDIEKAISYFKHAKKKGYSDAKHALVKTYMHCGKECRLNYDNQTDPNSVEAKRYLQEAGNYFKKAMKLESSDAKNALIDMYLNRGIMYRDGVIKSEYGGELEAHSYFEKAFKLGSSKAMRLSAGMYEASCTPSNLTNFDLAVTQYKKAYESNPTSKILLKIANLYLKVQKYEDAFNQFAQLVSDHDESGPVNLKDLNTPASSDKVAELFLIECKKGYTKAAFELGKHYFSLNGNLDDAFRAKGYFNEALNKGFDIGQYKNLFGL